MSLLDKTIESNIEEPINLFSTSIKKIDGTTNDYELITSLNPAFTTLSKEKLEEIQNIALKAARDIQQVLREE